MTAGILPARRVRRAPPLPNSVRGSADRRTSDTVMLLTTQGLCRRCRRADGDTASMTDTPSVRSLAGQLEQPTGGARSRRTPGSHLDLDAHARVGQAAFDHGRRRPDAIEVT